MPTTISLEDVQRVAAERLGVGVAGVSRLAGSVANQDFAVDLHDGSRAVLKGGPHDEIAAEAWSCGHLAGKGIAVPDVLAVDLDPSALGSPFLVLRFVTGEPSDDDAVVREAGAVVRRVHEVELEGWGSLTVEPGGDGDGAARGRFASWPEAVEAALSGLPGLVAAGVLEPRLAEVAGDLVRVEAVLGCSGPGVLLHHDLKPPHLFGERRDGARRLTAVIDWGDATVGDPVADLARMSMAGPAATAAFLDGYGLALTNDLADRLARHRVLWNVRALAYEHAAGGDWFDVYRSRIEDDAARLRA